VYTVYYNDVLFNVLIVMVYDVFTVVDPTPSLILATGTGIYTATHNHEMLARVMVEGDRGSDLASGKFFL